MSDPIPKKALGQHWLHDVFSLEAMCDAAHLTENDVVIEIGPGLGTLTNQLVKRAKSVTAIEFDDELFKQLPSRVLSPRLTVVHGDCLTFDYTSMPKGYKVVANIPYYLTSNLLRVLCESPNPPATIVLLVQKEVAERVVAQPGNMSILSATVQFYCEASLGHKVPALLFTPPPKVDSQILILHTRNRPLFTVDTQKFFALIKAGFSQKRKKLRTSISAGLGITKEETEKLLISSHIDPNDRPQMLTLNQWYALYKEHNKEQR
jgi:16S rRNA (adenine1518-N6/adenine1519-N6)-dimethyltransferase